MLVSKITLPRAVLALLCAYLIALSGVLAAWNGPTHLIHALNAPIFELCGTGDGDRPEPQAPIDHERCCLSGCAASGMALAPSSADVAAPAALFAVPGSEISPGTIQFRRFARGPGNPRAPPSQLV